MEYVIKQEKKENRCVILSAECSLMNKEKELYKVNLLQGYGMDIYRTEKEYKTVDRKKALATYNRYKKQL